MVVLGAASTTGGGNVVSSPYEGLKWVIAGNSFGQGNAGSNFYGHFKRMKARLNLNSQGQDIAVGGTASSVIAKAVLNDSGGILTVLQNTSTNESDVWCLFVDALVTDHIASGNTPSAAAQSKSRNSIASILAGVRGASRVASTAGSYTGTWTANSPDTEAPPNNTTSSTTTLNDSVTFTGLPSGGRIAVMLMAIDDTALGTAGAAYSITSSGTTLTTGTTSNKHTSAGTAGSRALMPIMVTLPGGNTTLTIKKTDANGPILYVAGLFPQVAYNAGASHVCLVKCFKYNAATQAGVDYYNAALALAVSDVTYGAGDPGIVVFDPNNLSGWNQATMMDNGGIHPNDRGWSLIAGALATYIATNATYGTPRNYQTPY